MTRRSIRRFESRAVEERKIEALKEEIAEALGVSVKTVEYHKRSIMDTLDLRTTAELTRYAVKHNIISL